jgi:putative DNA primase/helicase
MFVFPIGETKYWRRPGKRGPGISATTNHDRTDRLFVFSTSTEFETDCYYSKFAAYTLLKYGSTSPEAFQAAARDLAQRGYR